VQDDLQESSKRKLNYSSLAHQRAFYGSNAIVEEKDDVINDESCFDELFEKADVKSEREESSILFTN